MKSWSKRRMIDYLSISDCVYVHIFSIYKNSLIKKNWEAGYSQKIRYCTLSITVSLYLTFVLLIRHGKTRAQMLIVVLRRRRQKIIILRSPGFLTSPTPCHLHRRHLGDHQLRWGQRACRLARANLVHSRKRNQRPAHPPTQKYPESSQSALAEVAKV